MVQSRIFTWFGLIVTCFVASSNTWAESPVSVKELLPTGEIHADIMALGLDQETQRLTAKFQESIQKNREWFAQYVASTPGGEPLSYHPNFGLTPEEFKKVKSAMSKLSLVKVGNGSFRVEAQGDIVELKAEGELSGLNNLRISLSTNVLETPFGECRLYKPFVSSSSSALMSSGHEWDYDNGLSQDQLIAAIQGTFIPDQPLKDIKFVVGKASQSGRKLLWFKAREFSQDRKTVYADIMVEF